MSQEKKYYPEIAILKGLAILFVLLGHSFPDYTTGFTSPSHEFIFRLMYSFHMPLFFMISGFLFTKHLKKKNTGKEKWQLIKQKFIYLMIPYFVYTIITFILKLVFSQYAVNSFTIQDITKIFLSDNPNGGLWFLYVLFFITMLAILLFDNHPWKVYLAFVFSLILVYVANFIPDSLYYLTRILRNFPFFTLGIIINYHYPKFQKIMNKNYILGLILFLYSYLFLPKFSFETSNFYTITLALSGILWSYILASMFNTESRGGKILTKLSQYAMPIYLLSYFISVPLKIIAVKLAIPTIITVILNISLGSLIPMIITKYIIQKNKVLNLLLLGRRETCVKE